MAYGASLVASEHFIADLGLLVLEINLRQCTCQVQSFIRCGRLY